MLIFISLVAALSFYSCRKENGNINYNLPPVNFTININNPSYIDLKLIGGWVYVSGGSKGIILFRKDQETINAFDRLNPHNESTCILSVDNSNLYAVDTCKAMKFLLIDGSPSSSNASRTLIQYNTVFTGSTLSVSNY